MPLVPWDIASSGPDDADTGGQCSGRRPERNYRCSAPPYLRRSERCLGEKKLPASATLVDAPVDVRPQRRAGLALIVLEELTVDELALHELAAREGGAAKNAFHEARFDE